MSKHSYNSIHRKVKNIIVRWGLYAPNLAHWLLNILGLRGV